MYRKIEEYLKNYFSSKEEKILVIDGARQVGKTYIIEKIGKEYYRNFISINLDADKKGDRVFEDVKTCDDFYIQLSALYGNKLNNRDDTLVFIDEISIYPQFFSLLKQLRIDNKYRYICSGSLLGIELLKTGLTPMGSIIKKEMYPMDFEEFLIANNFGSDAINYVRESYENKTSLNESLHNTLLNLFLTYLYVGGLPDAVKSYVEEKNVFKMSFERKNLAYVVREAEDKQGEMIHILQSVGGSAIIYVRSRKRTKEMAQLLSQQGITATFYHAGLDPDVKDQRQKAWQKDEVRVMCATNAFGMGIDKPDVRMVIHIDCPDSLEAYFQEAGRAGRDGQKSYAVLLYNKHDELKLSKRVEDTFPQKELIQDIYEHLAYFYQIGVGSGQGKTFEFDIEKFCIIYKYFPTKVDAALRILERSGYLHYEDNPDGKARVMFLLGRNDLYLLDQLSPSQDAVVTALLRSYGSLFVDLTYIDEAMIARQAELTIQQVYFALKSLAARHIIKFIPRRKIPFITYTRDRVDGNKVVIPKEVWESRREQYEKRIKSMIHYAKNDEECRSKQLLAYFGEENDSECKQCDVCLANREDDKEKELRMKVAENQIIIEDHHIIEKKD